MATSCPSPVTWRQLRSLGDDSDYENRWLVGEVSFKDEEHWSLAPNLRLVDAEGEDGCIFFQSETGPVTVLINLELGDVVEVPNPRLRIFADTQDGLRITDVNSIRVTHSPGLSLEQKLRYSGLMRAKGNRWVELQQWEKAYPNYSRAVDLLCGSFPEPSQDLASTIRGACFANMLLCDLQLHTFHRALETGEVALGHAVTPHIRAKVCFRMAQACDSLRDPRQALTYAQKALAEAPQDEAVQLLCSRLHREVMEDGKALTTAFRRAEPRLTGMRQRFGYRSNLFDAHDGRSQISDVAAEWNHQRLHQHRPALLRHMLYVCDGNAAPPPNFGVKTVIIFLDDKCRVSQCAWASHGKKSISRVVRRKQSSSSKSVAQMVPQPSLDTPTTLFVDILSLLMPWWASALRWLFTWIGLTSLWERIAWWSIQGQLRTNYLTERCGPEVLCLLEDVLGRGEHYPIAIVERSSHPFLTLLSGHWADPTHKESNTMSPVTEEVRRSACAVESLLSDC